MAETETRTLVEWLREAAYLQLYGRTWADAQRFIVIRVGVVDTGIDYTHSMFGGLGTKEAYESNDPLILEPNSFPISLLSSLSSSIGGSVGEILHISPE